MKNLRKNTYFIAITLLLVTSFLTLSSCKQKGCTDIEALNFDVEADQDNGTCVYDEQLSAKIKLNFNPIFSGNQMLLNTSYAVNDSIDIKLTLVRMYISSLKLNNIEFNEVALIDLATSSTSILETNVSPGVYDQLDFTIGLSDALNETDPANEEVDSPLSSYENMWWGWANKYIYFKIEGIYDLNSEGTFSRNFVYHVGGSGYEGLFTNSSVQLDIQDVQTEEININIAFDQFFSDQTGSIDLLNEDETHTLNNQALAQKVSSRLLNSFSASTP